MIVNTKVWDEPKEVAHMNIVGYTDKFSVHPEDSIKFMVSCQKPQYTAQLVRLIHGDPNPDGPGYKEEVIESPIDGTYPGKYEELRSGSYITIPNDQSLHLSGSFTLASFIYPTTPSWRTQGILTKGSNQSNTGYRLMIDDDGGIALALGSNGSNKQVGTGIPLRNKFWYFVAASYDATNGKVSLYQIPITIWPQDSSHAVAIRDIGPISVSHNSEPLIMAGWSEGQKDGKQNIGGLYNGKIESPVIFSRALGPDEIKQLYKGASPKQVGSGLVAHWDFARDFSTNEIVNVVGNKLHGKMVNRPCRAMTGHNWSGDEPNYRHAPQEYGAIYFHDDDLDDAGWDVDFELTVPANLKSGIYAIKISTDGGDDHLPFFVRPPKGTATAPVLFLVPTNSYLAYANIHVFKRIDVFVEMAKKLSDVEGVEDTFVFDYPSTDPDKYMFNNKLNSLYDYHREGSGVSYSSRLRPILNMRPSYNLPLLGLAKGAPHQLNADLHLTDWLETMGYDFDVATDEDLHFEGKALLERYKVVISGSHPEYWTGAMLDGLEEYLSDGGRHMYLGGNGYYWITSFVTDSPHCIEVRRHRGTEAWEADPGEYYHASTGELGGLWRFRGRPPQKLVGVGFSSQGFDYDRPYDIQAESSDPRADFIFKGVDKSRPLGDFGLIQGGAAGFEIDRADIDLGTPPHALVLATATGFSDLYQHVIEEALLMDGMQGGTVNPMVKSDIVFYEGPKGGAVFSVGSISWCGSLSHNNYDNDISRITGNVLDRFISEDGI